MLVIRFNKIKNYFVINDFRLIKSLWKCTKIIRRPILLAEETPHFFKYEKKTIETSKQTKKFAFLNLSYPQTCLCSVCNNQLLLHI